jgi:hypothetical protein
MFGKIILVLMILTVITGAASALESSTCIFNADNSLNLNLITHQSYFKTQSNITLYSDEGQIPWGGHPAAAGFVNTFFGIWSWTNKDYLGGVVTTGLYCLPLVIFFSLANPIGAILIPVDTFANIALYGIGFVSLVTAPIFGFIRGYTEYNKRTRALNIASAFNDNPLKHISFAIFPTFDKRNVAGALTYSLSF